MIEKTLVMVKPDGVAAGLIGTVLQRFEEAGLHITGLKMVKLTKADACRFYEVHKEKAFYDSLTDFMSSGPIVAVLITGSEAISKVRKIMGATNPAEAAEGTIRRDFARSIERNIVHGSDAPETAAVEIPFFFSRLDQSNI